MPEWARFALLLAMAAWAGWYFSRLLWVAIGTGRIIDSGDGHKPVTRDERPVAFWVCVVVAAAMVVAMPYLIITLIGDLAGLWESGI